MDIKKPKLSILATIYKNADNIIPFYNELQSKIIPYIDDYEIIMVDDDSPDNAWEIMTELASKDNHIKLIKHSRNFGAHEALYTACKYSSGDCISEKSVDLQEPASLMLEMYENWKGGNRLCLAVRQHRNDGVISDLFSNMYYWVIRLLVNRDMPKGGFDIWMADRAVIQHLLELNERNSPLSLQLLWLGYHPKKIYYDRQRRKIGKSSWSFSKKIKMFMDSLIAFSYLPIRFMSIMGFLFFVASIVWTCTLIVDKLRGTMPVLGYTSLAILVLFSAGIIMFTLGVLGEYIWRTMEAAKQRPLAIVESLVNFDDLKEDKDV